MSKLEDLRPNAAVRGILPDCLATVISVQWFGSEALDLTYKTPEGKLANELLYRHDEKRIEVVEQGRPWRAACSACRPDCRNDGKTLPESVHPVDTQVSAAKARAIVMEVERSLGFDPIDRETEKLGYDIESRIPGTGRLRFIEVKGRVSGANTVTVTKNEILYSLNKPEDFILAIVEFMQDESNRVHYLRHPFQREPDFGVTSINYNFAKLLLRAEEPA